MHEEDMYLEKITTYIKNREGIIYFLSFKL